MKRYSGVQIDPFECASVEAFLAQAVQNRPAGTARFFQTGLQQAMGPFQLFENRSVYEFEMGPRQGLNRCRADIYGEKGVFAENIAAAQLIDQLFFFPVPAKQLDLSLNDKEEPVVSAALFQNQGFAFNHFFAQGIKKSFGMAWRKAFDKMGP